MPHQRGAPEPSRAVQASDEIAYRRAGCSRHVFSSNEEPLLDEVLADPLVRRMMECDGVEMAALRLLIGETQRQLY